MSEQPLIVDINPGNNRGHLFEVGSGPTPHETGVCMRGLRLVGLPNGVAFHDLDERGGESGFVPAPRDGKATVEIRGVGPGATVTSIDPEGAVVSGLEATPDETGTKCVEVPWENRILRVLLHPAGWSDEE